MHLILVSDRLAATRTLTLTTRHVVIGLVVAMLALLGMSSLLSYVTVRFAAEWRVPVLVDMVRSITAEDSLRSAAAARENLNAMAARLGEMQAQLIHLGTLGERLAGSAGVKVQELRTATPSKDGRGGPLVEARALTDNELQRAVDALARAVDVQADAMAAIETQMLDERIRTNQMPTTLPVDASWSASSYGWRLDPFTNQRALHEGVDFAAPEGEPIRAASAGIVAYAGGHPEYGRMVDVDHGEGLITRYAHASAVLVKEGEFVKRGQLIARVGNSGRSTGPHLHFEVRRFGIAQNPDRFLRVAKGGNAGLVAFR